MCGGRRGVMSTVAQPVTQGATGTPITPPGPRGEATVAERAAQRRSRGTMLTQQPNTLLTGG